VGCTAPSKLAGPLLAIVLGVAAAPPARATGDAADAVMLLRAFAGPSTVPVLEQEISLDPDDGFVAAFTVAAAALGDGLVQVSVNADPDPVLGYGLSVQNATTSTQPVTLLITMPLAPVGSPNQVSSSLDLVLTDGSTDGVAISPQGLAIASSFLSEDGSVFTPMGVDLGGAAITASTSLAAGPIAGPAPGAGPTWSWMSLVVSFDLSPLDGVELDGVVTVVPEPAPAWLAMACLAAWGAARRRAPA
jgi:hypothetical protein